MIIRPVDASGDILPVLSSSDMLTGSAAVARLVYGRLSLLAGEWWEDPESGFRIMDTLSSSFLTEADAPMLASQIAAYIRETPGVEDVENAACNAAAGRLSFSCDVRTPEGTAFVSFDFAS